MTNKNVLGVQPTTNYFVIFYRDLRITDYFLIFKASALWADALTRQAMAWKSFHCNLV